jgi:RNA polymerase sigma-70 factor (ECF subfamily)
MGHLADQELIRETLAGSGAAYELLMRRYERLVYRVSYGYVHDRDDALDVTQDVFVRAYERLDSFRGAGSFKGWLMVLTHRVNLNWRRTNRRDADREELTTANAPAVGARQEQDLLRREEAELVLRELEVLNPRQVLAVTLRYFERMPVKEIAEVLDCSVASTKNILFRSLERLRRNLAPYWRVDHESMRPSPRAHREAPGG